MNSVEYYASLLEDRPRIDAFLRAIARTVKPGDGVVEIGCGIGTYALAALKAGAAHVTAIDLNPTAIALARELGVERESGGRIRLVEGAAEAVELPRPADVVIFEDYGGLGHAPGLKALLDHVRTRLAVPGARWIPESVDLMIAPVDRPLRTLEEGGLPLSPAAFALLRKRSLNDPFSPDLEASALSGPPQALGRLVPSAEIPRRLRHAGAVKASRAGSMTGLLGWIRLQLGGGESVDNAPSVPPPTYPPIALPFEDPLPVGVGETVELELETIYGPGPRAVLWKWNARGPKGAREGCSINGLPGDLELLKRGSTGEIPAAGNRLQAVAEICRQIDGKRSVEEIARSVYSLYMKEFQDERAAVAFVLEVLERFRGIAGR